jgi:predicted choloylglycine hydrolase
MVDLGYFGYSMVNQPSEPRGLEFTPYFPFDGMNEKGLVVGMAAIPHAEPPSSTGKVSIGEIEVIRLLLDYAANVEEAIELIEDYNVVMTEPPIHYLIADAYGNSVIIEFLDNKMEFYKSNESQIITNFLVSRVNLPDGSQCMRYNAVSSGIENNVDMSVEGAFNLLEASAQSSTIWSVVYDIQNLMIHVVMGGKYTQIHSFEFLEPE